MDYEAGPSDLGPSERPVGPISDAARSGMAAPVSPTDGAHDDLSPETKRAETEL